GSVSRGCHDRPPRRAGKGGAPLAAKRLAGRSQPHPDPSCPGNLLSGDGQPDPGRAPSCRCPAPQCRQTEGRTIRPSPEQPPASGSPPSFLRRRWRLLLTLLGAVIVLVVGGRHAWAWYQLCSGRAQLVRHHPELARVHLERCLAIWPNSVDAL